MEFNGAGRLELESVIGVEDDPGVLDLIVRALGAPGRSIRGCRNAAEGLAALRTLHGRVNLVVSDVVLPDLSGPDMVRKMRALDPAIRVLFISGYSDDLVKEYLGDLDYPVLLKPFTVQALRCAADLAIHAPSLTRAGLGA